MKKISIILLAALVMSLVCVCMSVGAYADGNVVRS